MYFLEKKLNDNINKEILLKKLRNFNRSFNNWIIKALIMRKKKKTRIFNLMMILKVIFENYQLLIYSRIYIFKLIFVKILIKLSSKQIELIK